MFASRNGPALTIAALALVACRAKDEPSDERIAIDAEHVEQICRGTLVHAESELARIEAELELAPMSEQVQIRVVPSEQIGEWCPDGDEHCVIQPPRQLVVSAGAYGRVLARELVRDRLARSAAGSTKPMFSEGVATALTRPMCAAKPGWNPPPSEPMLSESLGTSLNEQELYVAGELLRWLLDTRGPDAVFDFMVTLDRQTTPDEVRVAYLEHFGTAIELDIYAHWRPPEQPLDLEQADCVGPEPSRDEARSRLSLAATFDCGSSTVRNDFTSPGRAFVEWIWTIDESTAGDYRLAEALPDGFELTLSTCECDYRSWTYLPSNDSVFWEQGSIHPEHGVTLAPGVYRLRVYGPIGSSLDHEIITPCDVVEQNCADGQQCTPDGHCRDEVEEPGQAGDPCWYNEEQLECATGLTCIAAPGHVGQCMIDCGEPTNVSCPDGLICGPAMVCTQPCDPFAPACEDDWLCVPDFELGGGGCYPIPAGNLGLLEPCSLIESVCGPGLTCETLHDLDGCHEPGAWIDFSGCCTPICDPAAADPGCPPELPNCQVDEGDVLGTCAP